MVIKFDKRRRFLLDREFQLRFIGHIFIFFYIAAFIAGATVFHTGWSMLGEKIMKVYPQGRAVFILKTVNIALLRNLLLVSPLIFIPALILSHRLAGPVHRIKMVLREIGRGDFQAEIKLRKRDELADLVKVVNTMAQELKVSTEKKKSLTQKLANEVDNLMQESEKKPEIFQTLRPNIERIKTLIKELA
jgi:methyl-accepting chemotaxis protein